MEFTSIDIRMTLTNTKVMTSSGTIILYVKLVLQIFYGIHRWIRIRAVEALNHDIIVSDYKE